MLTQKIKNLKVENIYGIMLWSMVLATFCCLMVLIYKSRFWGVQLDSAFCYYVAWLMSEGAVLYRDIFDVNFPGTYLIYLFVFTFLGEGDIYWRIFDLLCLAGINVLILLYCKPFGTLAGWIGITLFSAFHLYNGPLYMGQRDFLILFFLLGAVYCIAQHLERCRDYTFLATSGVLLGSAALIKPHTGILFLFILFIIVVQALRSGTEWVKDFVVFTASCCVAPILSIMWLWYAGGLQAFLDILFNFAFVFYSKFTFQTISNLNLLSFIGIPQLEIAAIAVIVLVGCIIIAEHRMRRILLAVCMLYGLCYYYLQTRCLYQLYSFTLFMFISIATWTPCLRSKAPVLIRLAMFIVLLQLCLVSLYRSATTIVNSPPHHITTFPPTDMLVQNLSEKLPPGETVQTMEGLSGGIHALYTMRYKPPTRFLYDVCFFQDIEHPYIKKIRAEFLHDLKSRPPAYFVLFKKSWPLRDYERLETFPELRNWLHENYVIEISSDFYHLYHRK